MNQCKPMKGTTVTWILTFVSTTGVFTTAMETHLSNKTPMATSIIIYSKVISVIHSLCALAFTSTK